MNNRKIAVVTGASSGIGQAVAKKLHNEGYTLALGARRVEKLKSIADEASFGADTLIAKLDLVSQPSIEYFCGLALEKFGQVDIIVNCAGLAIGREPADQGNLDDWRAMVETDYFGPMALIRSLLPKMKEDGGGTIINIGALAALFPHPGSAAYASAKDGIRMFLKCLREDTLGTGIRVTNIDPGITKTDFALVRFRGDNEMVNKLLDRFTPLNPEDVADCVWFAVNAPPHVNIDQLTVTPTDQSNPTRLHKRQ